MSSLIHLIYASTATVALSDDDLIRLLRTARQNNSSKDVTGMLLYSGGSFFQVLEGDEQAVGALYAHISRDPRHANVVKIVQEPISQRAFGEWSMSFTRITSHELQKILGLSDALEGGVLFQKLGEGRAKKLLRAFVGGRWRSEPTQYSSAAPDGAQGQMG